MKKNKKNDIIQRNDMKTYFKPKPRIDVTISTRKYATKTPKIAKTSLICEANDKIFITYLFDELSTAFARQGDFNFTSIRKKIVNCDELLLREIIFKLLKREDIKISTVQYLMFISTYFRNLTD